MTKTGEVAIIVMIIVMIIAILLGIAFLAGSFLTLKGCNQNKSISYETELVSYMKSSSTREPPTTSRVSPRTSSMETFLITPRSGFDIDIAGTSVEHEMMYDAKKCSQGYARLASASAKKLTVKSIVEAKKENNAKCQMRVTVQYNETVNILDYIYGLRGRNKDDREQSKD